MSEMMSLRKPGKGGFQLHHCGVERPRGIGKLGFLVQDVGARREHAGMALTFRFSVPVAGDYQMLFDILATEAEIKHVRTHEAALSSDVKDHDASRASRCRLAVPAARRSRDRYSIRPKTSLISLTVCHG